jgi:hypothetical protein
MTRAKKPLFSAQDQAWLKRQIREEIQEQLKDRTPFAPPPFPSPGPNLEQYLAQEEAWWEGAPPPGSARQPQQGRVQPEWEEWALFPEESALLPHRAPWEQEKAPAGRMRPPAMPEFSEFPPWEVPPPSGSGQQKEKPRSGWEEWVNYFNEMANPDSHRSGKRQGRKRSR